MRSFTAGSMPALPDQTGALTMIDPERLVELRHKFRGKRISKEGMNFLKCAFAPPDFAFSGDNGIPDGNPTRRSLYRHKQTFPISFVSGNDYYFLLLPVPGYAFFYASVAAGTPILSTTLFQGFPYADYLSLFGTFGNEAGLVTKWRHVSNAFELVPTANEMTWSGNIQCWRASINQNLRRDTSQNISVGWAITGLQSCNASNAHMYQAAFKEGCYSLATSSDNNYPYTPIVYGNAAMPEVLTTDDFGAIAVSSFNPGGAVPGIDNGFDSVIMKISGITANESGYMRSWACVEYAPQTNTVLYNMSSGSDCRDDVALELYQEIAKMLPIGVRYLDNDSFWTRVLAIIQVASAAGSSLPGQYGMISGGVNTITRGLQGLYAM